MATGDAVERELRQKLLSKRRRPALEEEEETEEGEVRQSAPTPAPAPAPALALAPGRPRANSVDGAAERRPKRSKWDNSSDEEEGGGDGGGGPSTSPTPPVGPPSRSPSPGRTTDDTPGGDGSSQGLGLVGSTPPGPNGVTAIEAPSTAAAGAAAEDQHNPLWFGCRSVNHFQWLDRLQEGTFGVVYKAKNKKTGELVALKKVKMTDKTSRDDGFPITALRETNVLLALQHPNIVAVREMVVGKEMDKVFMVMELFENDLKMVIDLQKKRNRDAIVQRLGDRQSAELVLGEDTHVFTAAQSKCLMQQLLRAMDYMHRCWYIHRDLKTSNILYKSGQGRLAVCDFGLARKYGDPIVAPYTFNVVTLWYRPPELLMGKKMYNTSLDMWSVGCIFAEILRGEPLFDGTSEINQLKKIFSVLGAPTAEQWPEYDSLPHAKTFTWKGMKPKLRDLFRHDKPGKFISDNSSTLSEAGFDLLSRLLAMDPARRLTAAEALRHPYFSEAPHPIPPSQMPSYPSGGP